MNIHQLLSPSADDSYASDANNDDASSVASSSPPKLRPSLAGGKRTASGLSQELKRSPDRGTLSPPSTTPSAYASPARAARIAFNPHPTSITAPNFRPLPPTSTPSTEGYAHAPRPAPSDRASSTPLMGVLKDVASKPRRKPAAPRAYSSNNARQAELSDTTSPSLGSPPLTAPPVARSISRQSLADLTMAEAPSQTPPPRHFTSSALSDDDSKTVTDLLKFLEKQSYAYEQHVQLIDLLHKGFLKHSHPTTQAGDDRLSDPHSYVLLDELRQAREAMDSRFAVGEDIWLDWLSDAMVLARTYDERMNATELFQKAVQDEPASVKLWDAYGSWIHSNYLASNGLEGADLSHWTVEDQEICKELFTKDMLLSVYEQAISATQWRIDHSHILWSRYAQLVEQEFPSAPSTADIQRLVNLYIDRLQIPHATSSETADKLWKLISKLSPNDARAIMERAQQQSEPVQRQMELRREHEYKLERAINSGDRETMQDEFSRYFKWEKKPNKQATGLFEYQLRCALYERALLRFPTSTDWWLDYVDYAISRAPNPTDTLLPLIERSTRHCPWSGDLWARRILRADFERVPRDDIESIKHRATNAGLLDIGGLEELVKVLQQWCSYLRRHAFRRINSEDDVDTAEMGITAALEDVTKAGEKIYGKEFHGDPLFRLEQIQIKFYTEGRRVPEAREIYRRVAKRLGGSFDFWSKYYNWELWLWGYDRMTEKHRVETTDNGPDLATVVVQEALRQRDLDWPEKVLEMYLYHFQQHESGAKLQAALIEAREFTNRLAGRRAREAAEASDHAAQHQAQLAAAVQITATDDASGGEKRKRDNEPTPNGDRSKKPKTDVGSQETTGQHESSASASAQTKRDREHNTITIRSLPASVQELDIKKFFRDVGVPLSINILRGKEGETASAAVEFETQEDVLAAKTRTGREIDGHEVTVHSGGLNTLYVTNYPPEFDESSIRDLFKTHGDIVSVRFPSLKFDSRRRFCYVTFLTADVAETVERAMDGSLVGEHKLVAKISNPDAKKQRMGAQAEQREVFVRNIDREASDGEVKDFFAQFGVVERLNILKLVNNRKTGQAFVVYTTSEEAESAVTKAHNQPLRSRNVQVELSKPKGRAPPLERAKKEDFIVKQSGASASPEPDAGSTNGLRRGSDVSMTSSAPVADDSYLSVKERKAAIFNLPDTVNDSRIRVALEKYGPVTKIQLRRDKAGAIVEFTNINDAFNVRQGVDVTTLGPDVHTGNVGDLLKLDKVRKQKPTNGVGSTSAQGEALKPPTFMKPASLSRPNRGGRRGGLGFKSSGLARSNQGTGDAPSGAGSAASSGKKSNADFRNMLEQSQKIGESGP